MYALQEKWHGTNQSANFHDQLNTLKELCRQHPIWQSPLLIAAESGSLKHNDYQFLFSQYYLYSKNFSRFLAAVMANCENDFYRSKLAENLWEESGEKDLENRHAEIFRRFLTDSLGLSLSDIEFKAFTQKFVSQYMSLCLDFPPLESSAVLSLGTEGIVSTLYAKFKTGLLAADFKENELQFFNIHIECDDAHAATLEEIVLSYAHEKHWFERCKQAMLAALDLRLQFFNHIYAEMLQINIKPLLEATAYRADKPAKIPQKDALIFHTDFDKNLLYHNQNDASNINFQVQRIPVEAQVLDPRLVVIPPGFNNEYHEHAHETLFLILEGEGEVLIDDYVLPIHAHNIVYVPRWLKHQTRNTGKGDLKFFAVTDYGLTGRFPINSEAIYRHKKENLGELHVAN